MTADTPTRPVRGAPTLRPPRHTVDPRSIGWWTAQELAFHVPFTAVLAVVYVATPVPGWLVVVPVLTGVIGAAAAIGVPRWKFRVHRWETTSDAVDAASGWFWQEWRVAPLARIQTVDTAHGPLQRAFGLASVTVTTASAAGPIRIDGLDHELAADLVTRLTALTQATPGDAT